MVISLPHSQAPSGLNMIGCPINLSSSPISYRLPPPLLGEHTKEVLRDQLGYSDETIQNLEKEGVVRLGWGTVNTYSPLYILLSIAVQSSLSIVRIGFAQTFMIYYHCPAALQLCTTSNKSESKCRQRRFILRPCRSLANSTYIN